MNILFQKIIERFFLLCPESSEAVIVNFWPFPPNPEPHLGLNETYIMELLSVIAKKFHC